MAQSWLMVLVLVVLLALCNHRVEAAVVKHTFHVGNFQVERLCNSTTITGVDGQLPGPTIYINEGDTLIVDVINESPYNITIHWHGVQQRLSNWQDGVDMITQCPIQPGNSYTYKFSITGQEGTLWWHSHASALRATIYGALVIRPRQGSKGYPFPKPHEEIPILLGEWYNDNVEELEEEAYLAGALYGQSNSYTINGRPGDLVPCSRDNTFKMRVKQGKTYMLRMVNAAMNSHMFFRIAGHTFTVVAIDAQYTTPYHSDVLVLAPGQSLDALMVANAPPARYYMAAHVYISNYPEPTSLSILDQTTTTGIVEYKTSRVPKSVPPVMPLLPSYFDTPVAHQFYSNITGLLRTGSPTVPQHVDERMFITVGMGSYPCMPDQLKCNRTSPNQAIAASLNNVSFVYPTKMSLLEAYHYGIKGVYATDFPDRPPLEFDYTSLDNLQNFALFPTEKATRLKKLKYNATVEMVLQDTALNGLEGHPIHLHGFNFYVLAQGFGNYDAATAVKSYNLVNPQVRNTIAVPRGGWAVIRNRCMADSVSGMGGNDESPSSSIDSSSCCPAPSTIPLNQRASDLSTDLRLGLSLSSSSSLQEYSSPEEKHNLRRSLFVKVYMEGIPIGRKLDLYAHDGYVDLINALRRMFRATIMCKNRNHCCNFSIALPTGSFIYHQAKLVSSLSLSVGGLVHACQVSGIVGDQVSSDKVHVVTYEDKDGDWMMIGDTPWELFLTTVRRLKVTRADKC